MKVKNRNFSFIPERTTVELAEEQPVDKRGLFYYLSSLFMGVVLLAVGIYLYTTFNNSMSVFQTPAPFLPPIIEKQSLILTSERLVELDSFLIRFKVNREFHLSKFDIVLQVSGHQTKNEIEKSINTVRDHLVFILSGTKAIPVIDYNKRSSLKKEIVDQLNLFLVAGKVEQVQLNEQALN